jgi:hypothetical protein
MIVPSHFVPLAAPGMVALGLRWMWNPESPFYMKPRLDFDLFSWAFRFWRSSSKRHGRLPFDVRMGHAARRCEAASAGDFTIQSSYVHALRSLLKVLVGGGAKRDYDRPDCKRNLQQVTGAARDQRHNGSRADEP